VSFRSIISFILLVAIAVPTCCCTLARIAIIFQSQDKQLCACCAAEKQTSAPAKPCHACGQIAFTRELEKNKIDTGLLFQLPIEHSLLFVFKVGGGEARKNLFLSHSSLPRPPLSPQALLCLFRC
jgi:hypothetical protein